MKKIYEILNNIDMNGNISLKLLRIHSTKREGVSFLTRNITIDNPDILKSHIISLQNKYLNKDMGTINGFEGVEEYNGAANGRIIYYLHKESELIKEEYEKLLNAILNSDNEEDPFKLKASAYVICGVSNEKPVYIFSMQNPLTILKNKLLYDKGTFREMKTPVLSLKSSLDVVAYDGRVYMFSLAAENLFAMERSYRKICDEKVKAIQESEILIEIDVFEQVAKSGSNPRRFVSYNEFNLNKLKNRKRREKIAKKFDIPLKDDKLDGSEKENSEKIIKLLCGKGMLDPFDELPKEVSDAKEWR